MYVCMYMYVSMNADLHERICNIIYVVFRHRCIFWVIVLQHFTASFCLCVFCEKSVFSGIFKLGSTTIHRIFVIYI